MMPRAAMDAGHAIARLLWDRRRPGQEPMAGFPEIYDEIENGHATYGIGAWQRFIQSRENGDYWFARIRSICGAELKRKGVIA